MRWPSLYQHLPMITNSQWTIWNHQKHKGEFHRDLTQPHLKWWLRIGESSNIDPSWLHFRFTEYYEILFQFIDTLHRNTWIHFLEEHTTKYVFKTPNLKHHEDMSYGSNKKKTDWPRTQTFLGVVFFWGSQEAPKMQLEHGSPMSHDLSFWWSLGKLEVRMEWYLFVVMLLWKVEEITSGFWLLLETVWFLLVCESTAADPRV